MTIHSTATRHRRLKSAQVDRAPTSMVLRGGNGPEVAFVPVDKAHAIDSPMKQERP